MSTPTHRPLSTKQLDILRLLYSFRFATTELLTQSLSTKSKIKMNERLKVLLDQEYIGRNFNPEYRLLRKHASYYLLPKGINALKQIPDNKFVPSVLRNIRKDKAASNQFIDYSLGMYSIYCQFRDHYGGKLHFFTKSQLTKRYDYFAEFVPGAYARVEVNGAEQDYFIEYLQSTKPFFTIVQRLKQYVEYASGGDWEVGTESDLPKVLLVCDNESLQKRLLKRAQFVLEDADDELELFVAVRGKIDSWHNLTEPDEVLTLSQI